MKKLPGIGQRGAERMAFSILTSQSGLSEALRLALAEMEEEVAVCPECGYFTQGGECLICHDQRDTSAIMVVERPIDVIAMEKAGGYRGLYHVLGGHLSPLKGIGPSQLTIGRLRERINDGDFVEVILATSPSVEGDATALYLSREIGHEGLRITRLGRGVPMGGSLEFADSGTLRMAMESRRGMDH